MRNIVITGSTRGIGRGLAEFFLNKGCNVTINGTSEKSVNKALNELNTVYADRVFGVVGMTSNYKDMQKLFTEAEEHFGNIDIWINNAGVNQDHKLFKDIELEGTYNVIDTNIKGVINGSNAALKNMLRYGKGAIYNMEGFGSNGKILPRMTIYGTSKYAVSYFTRSLANEVKDTGIIVGRLSPGMVVTDFLMQSVSGNSEAAEKNKKVFNILADNVDDVTAFLGRKILVNTKNDVQFIWLTPQKAMYRFITSPFNKRNFFDKK